MRLNSVGSLGAAATMAALSMAGGGRSYGGMLRTEVKLTPEQEQARTDANAKRLRDAADKRAKKAQRQARGMVKEKTND